MDLEIEEHSHSRDLAGEQHIMIAGDVLEEQCKRNIMMGGDVPDTKLRKQKKKACVMKVLECPNCSTLMNHISSLLNIEHARYIIFKS